MRSGFFRAMPDVADNSRMSMPSDQAVPTCTPRQLLVARALAILLALLLFVGGATGISLFEQFKTQVRHLQGQLVEQPQIRQLAVLLDEQQRPPCS